jgi:two-component system, response regulator YesN
MKINAVIVDDEKIIADGFLLTFKENFPNVNFNCFYTSEDVMEFAKSNRIDLLITDIDMPIKNGISLAKDAKTLFPQMRTLFLTGMDTFDYVYNASKVKDAQYVLKIENEATIVHMVGDLIADILSYNNLFKDIGDIQEDYNHLKKEKVSNNLLHIFKFGTPLEENTVIGDKIFLIGRFVNGLEKPTLESIINLCKNHLKIDNGEIFPIDNIELVMFVSPKYFKLETLTNIQQIILKEHNASLSFIYTKEEYGVDEVLGVFNKCNDIFSMSNIKNLFVFAYEDFLDDNADKSVKIINNIRDYIWAHMNEDISLKKISEVLFYNESYLSRLFKKLTGSNFKDFVTSLRLEKSKYLLKNTDMMIKDICKNVGFDSTSHFQFFFKKNLGTTPLDYRRDYVEDKK